MGTIWQWPWTRYRNGTEVVAPSIAAVLYMQHLASSTRVVTAIVQMRTRISSIAWPLTKRKGALALVTRGQAAPIYAFMVAMSILAPALAHTMRMVIIESTKQTSMLKLALTDKVVD